MGSPRGEPERRPGENQVRVTLTRGFWIAKYEATQGEWTRAMGTLPGPLTTELPAGDDFPVGNVNFPEAENFCRTLTQRGRESGALPGDWEFRLPTEAQWEWAARAGTSTPRYFGETDKGQTEYSWFNHTYTPNPEFEQSGRGRQSVARLKPPSSGQTDYWDDSLPGFGLRVSAGGRRHP